MKTIEEILEQVLMKHHDDISKQDDDAIAEATLAIKELVEKAVDEKVKKLKTDIFEVIEAAEKEEYKKDYINISAFSSDIRGRIMALFSFFCSH